MLLPESPCSTLGENMVVRAVGTVCMGREGSLCQRVRDSEWMGAGLGEVQGNQGFQGEMGLFMGSWETEIH